MRDKNILLSASILLGFAALLHIVRVLAGWNIVIKNWAVPAWLSIVLFLIAGFLSYRVFVINRK